MKNSLTVILFVAFLLSSNRSSANDGGGNPRLVRLTDTTHHTQATKHLYIDVHTFQPGKVTYEDVAAAHAKDLVVEKKYGVDFLKFWVDTAKGLVYCLSTASDRESIIKTHSVAHGLLPDEVYEVTDGKVAKMKGGKNLYLDIHELGPGNVTAAAAAEVHKKDLLAQKKHGVNLINYWIDEKKGIVMCLAEAADSTDLINTHKEAHGLLPKEVMTVKQGQ